MAGLATVIVMNSGITVVITVLDLGVLHFPSIRVHSLIHRDIMYKAILESRDPGASSDFRFYNWPLLPFRSGSLGCLKSYRILQKMGRCNTSKGPCSWTIILKQKNLGYRPAGGPGLKLARGDW